MCKNCKTKENIVHSGTDAFVLKVLEDLHNICYSCANKND